MTFRAVVLIAELFHHHRFVLQLLVFLEKMPAVFRRNAWAALPGYYKIYTGSLDATAMIYRPIAASTICMTPHHLGFHQAHGLHGQGSDDQDVRDPVVSIVWGNEP